MCGIVGYIGKKQATAILIDGLKQLEYRGYDSAGIAVIDLNGKIKVEKKQGKVKVLEGSIKDIEGCCGIGHTRWATHGKPCDLNSHPHKCGKFAVVHNGIIENFLELKIQLVNGGAKFLSETDTEVIAQLLNKNYNGDFLQTVNSTIDSLIGSFAMAIICEDFPDKIIVAKRYNPLIIGVGDGENYIASDIPALAKHTKKVYVMQDDDLAVINNEKVVFYDKDLKILNKKETIVNIEANSLDIGNNESYMKKEIFEIPQSIRNTVSNYLYNTDLTKFKSIINNINKVVFVACGSAYHSGVIGKYVIEKLARIPCDTEIASEFRYKDPIINKDTLYVAVSQSGETADTIAAVKLIKKFGAPLIVVTNVATSSITNFADIIFPTLAGVEIGVAATKSYSTQVAMMYLLAFTIAKQKQNMDVKPYIDELIKIPESCGKILKDIDKIINVAGRISKTQSIFFIGRNLDYAVSLEGSLKLKEISYIHSEGYAAGELKHGTLALIDKDTVVIALVNQKELAEKTFNAIHEVTARGARIGIVTMFEEYLLNDENSYSFLIPKTMDILSPLLSVMPLQIFAYYMARARGCDPDKPRNLAKSVTVE